MLGSHGPLDGNVVAFFRHFTIESNTLAMAVLLWGGMAGVLTRRQYPTCCAAR